MMEIQENNTETWGKELATWKRGQTESQKKKPQQLKRKTT